MRCISLLLLAATTARSESAFGGWRLSPAKSTAAYPGKMMVRIAAHPRGEVFTIDRLDSDGRWSTVSTILYLDGTPRRFEDAACSGTESSRRLDAQTIEIVRDCGSGEWTRIVRRMRTPADMTLEIFEEHSSGRRIQRRLVLEKQ